MTTSKKTPSRESTPNKVKSATTTNKKEMATKLIDKDEDILEASLSIKAMAHPLRLKILCVIAANELTVQTIVDYIGSSQSNISQHLAILRGQGVLASRKDANRVFYRINDPRTLRLVGLMRDVFCTAS